MPRLVPGPEVAREALRENPEFPIAEGGGTAPLPPLNAGVIPPGACQSEPRVSAFTTQGLGREARTFLFPGNPSMRLEMLFHRCKTSFH